MTYDELLKEADNLNVRVKELDLRTYDGYCHGNRIAIDKKLKTNKEKACILAEELGHYHTTYGDITNQNKIENVKQEILARRWGYERLVGIVDIINAHRNGVRNRHELAEFLDVTEEFLCEAIEYYKCKYGLYYQIDNYLIYFDRLGVMEIF
ncbi:ImmA/IrrE family metallo-endopeptidase [Clostridium celatum]|uniref:ImmA/IrrE family metallo-endopeptidase n=1 Tax=Clostridium celatum TaxID=36834 RepID=UPI0029104007|nr:ImmA/IrrE family metallo-endopeptidase [Clostridium celatum]MDU6296055.1 ImmA/IrrE family metallo-endopeptidase [Clostridium celatum]